MYCNCQDKQFYLNEIAQRNSLISVLKGELKRITNQCQGLQDKLVMKDTELNKIKQDYENLSKQGQTLKEKIASQNKRYHNLSEQHCEQNKTINRFMSEMDKLKGQKQKLQEQNSYQQKTVEKQVHHITQLRQLLILQQASIEVLKNKCKTLEQDRNFLMMGDLQVIARHQYEQQIMLMRERLKMQVQKQSEEMLKGIDFWSKSISVGQVEECTNNREKSCQEVLYEQLSNDLALLANYLELGDSYIIETGNPSFSHQTVTNIFTLLKRVCLSKQQLLTEAETTRQVLDGEIIRLKENILELQNQVKSYIEKKQTVTVAVQVAGSVAASDNLAKLRKKMTDLVSVLEISVGFSVDLYHIIRNNSIERQYWREAQRIMFKALTSQTNKTNKFKSIALAVLAIETLKALTRKKNKWSSKTKESLKQISSVLSIGHDHLGRLLTKFMQKHPSRSPFSHLIHAYMNSNASTISPLKCLSELLSQMAVVSYIPPLTLMNSWQIYRSRSHFNDQQNLKEKGSNILKHELNQM